MRIEVYAKIKPTEDPNKVKKAVQHVFNGEIIVIDEGDGYRRVEGFSSSVSSLERLHNLIRAEQIIAAARSYLYKGLRGNTITFMLHKQAAYAGRISFIDSDRESPMGGIRFVIESDDPRRIIDWLAPSKYTSSERRSKPSENEV